MKLLLLVIFVLSFDSVLSQENQNTSPKIDYFNLGSALKSVLTNHKMIKATKNDVQKALKKQDIGYHGYVFSKTDDVFSSKDVYIQFTKVFNRN